MPVIQRRKVPPKLVMEFDYSYMEKSGQQVDPYTFIFDWASSLIPTARGMRRKHGISYRPDPFLVGAAAISLNGRDRKIGAFVGANQKLSKDTPKRCAEMKALGEAKKAGFHFPVGIFVAGTTDKELIQDVTGHPTATLSPCLPCSHLMQESTVIISVGHEDDVFEAYTGRELWGLYSGAETSSKPDLPIHDFGFVQFTGARALYEASIVPVMGIPEQSTRMIRAQQVVDSLRLLAA